MSDIRTRIVDILSRPVNVDIFKSCACSLCHDPAIADVLIHELGMTQETNYGTTYPRYPVTDQRLTRWVTEWKATE